MTTYYFCNDIGKTPGWYSTGDGVEDNLVVECKRIDKGSLIDLIRWHAAHHGVAFADLEYRRDGIYVDIATKQWLYS